MEPHSRQHHGTLQLPQALILLLRTCLAKPSNDTVTRAYTDLLTTFCLQSIKSLLSRLFSSIIPFVDRGSDTDSTFVGMVKLTALCGIGTAFWTWSKRRNKTSRVSIRSKNTGDLDNSDASATDPHLLKKHSSIRAYDVPSTGFTYPAIRTFYRPHPQESKLPKEPYPIPLLVFIHGLGGSSAQFQPMLVSLVNLAPCLAIDLPGCGISAFDPKSWSAYTTEALVSLLAVTIEAHRDRESGQKVILIGHSMGCSLATLLASPSSPYAHLISEHVAGLVAICPTSKPPNEKQRQQIERITSIPSPIFDLFRRWDRRGGFNSHSVLRMTGREAEEDTKKLQLRYNQQSRTPVWMRMVRGMLPIELNGVARGGIPGKEVWSGLEVPVFLAGGEADQVTPPEHIRSIVRYLGRDDTGLGLSTERPSVPLAAGPDPVLVDPELLDRKHQDSVVDASDLPPPPLEDTVVPESLTMDADESLLDPGSISSTSDSTTATDGTPNASSATPVPQPHPRHLVVKSLIMPKPAAHSLLFAPSTSRILSGLIGDFLSSHIDPRLSLGWQLQYLTTEGKWDVKNLEKWKKVQPVSQPIAGVFRAMKTLREVDEQHSPKIFVKEWASKISDVVDISHESPVYDPKGLEVGGITYHKFPTVSKLPPTVDEVTQFISLIDNIREERKGQNKGLIGVHCHYGFNRTGFFIVCYLIERLGYRVEDAVDSFAKARAPGIRHEHFIDALHVRYCIGLKKAPTL